MSIDQVVNRISEYPSRLVQITGGEPLLQEAVHPLMRHLCDAAWTVLLETSGACDISVCDPRVIRIVDLKAPASGECHRNLMSNLDDLRPTDEIKIVIGDRADFDWACDVVTEHDLPTRVAAVLLSPVFPQRADEFVAGHGGLDPALLAEWILDCGIDVRLQTQMHKQIWDPGTRGV